MTRFYAFAAAALLFVAPAFAQPAAVATLSEIKGRVLVNQGDEFKPATKGMQLRPGDRIMVQDDSSASLTYNDECRSQIEENKIYTVPDRSSCAGGTPLVQELNPAGGNAIGGASGTGNGGVGIMAAVVAAIDIWWLNEDDSDQVSP